MSANTEPTQHVQHAYNALAAAVACAAGDPAGADVDHHIDALADHGWNALFGAMYGWIEGLRTVDPTLPDDGSFALALFDATGAHLNPEGRVEPDILAASRIEVAMLNRDLTTADAVFAEAIRAGYGGEVVMVVLYKVARLLHRRLEERHEERAR